VAVLWSMADIGTVSSKDRNPCAAVDRRPDVGSRMICVIRLAVLRRQKRPKAEVAMSQLDGLKADVQRSSKGVRGRAPSPTDRISASPAGRAWRRVLAYRLSEYLSCTFAAANWPIDCCF